MNIENIYIITWCVYCEVLVDMEETIQCRACITKHILCAVQVVLCRKWQAVLQWSTSLAVMFMAIITGWQRQIGRRKQVELKTHKSGVTCLDAREGNEVIIYC